MNHNNKLLILIILLITLSSAFIFAENSYIKYNETDNIKLRNLVNLSNYLEENETIMDYKWEIIPFDYFEKGIWATDYDSEGKYEINITIQRKSCKANYSNIKNFSKILLIEILNKNRPPIFKKSEIKVNNETKVLINEFTTDFFTDFEKEVNFFGRLIEFMKDIFSKKAIISIKETDLLEYNYDVYDPENDSLRTYLVDEPEGFYRKNNSFLFVPGIDFVKTRHHHDFFDYFLRKGINLPLPREIKKVSFFVEATDEQSSWKKHKVTLIVSDVNTNPKITAYYPKTYSVVKAGEIAEFRIKAKDREEINRGVDKNSLTYEWCVNNKCRETNSDKFRIKFNPGMKNVKVIVSDGELYDTKKWKIKVK